MHGLVPVLLLALAASSAQAQWKWKDASGHVQYSDMPPPPGTPERSILQRPAAVPTAPSPAVAASSAATAASAGVDATLEAKRRKLEADEAARMAAQSKADADRRAAQQREACQQARTQLRTLDDGMRIARINASGEREYLDDNARAAETRRARDAIAADCK